MLEKTSDKVKVKEIDEGVRVIKNSVSFSLGYSQLNKHTVDIRVFVDASYATNDDLLSQF